MDIRNWPLGRIMQLPDNCFGRRWPIGLYGTLTDADAAFDIAEFALPERTVIWEVSLVHCGGLGMSVDVAFALGDHLPASDAEFNVMESLCSGIISSNGRRGHFEIPSIAQITYSMLRIPVAVSGRRIVARFIRGPGAAANAAAVITISSIPNEVPDCLF